MDSTPTNTDDIEIEKVVTFFQKPSKDAYNAIKAFYLDRSMSVSRDYADWFAAYNASAIV